MAKKTRYNSKNWTVTEDSSGGNCKNSVKSP